ncbi:MAG: hypothetical protein ACI4RT_01765 [Candidatus Spyradenecus sp.]
MSNELPVMVASPYGAPAIKTPGENALQTAVSSAREAQEVQAMVLMAKHFPRDERAAMDRILMACTREGLAEQAVYQYNRGGADVAGPSIRLAEAIARAWGNLDYGFRELEQSNGASTVETICWDIETNTRARRVFKVEHVRHTRYGDKALTDPRDIYELVANQASRRLRACILEIIPSDVVEAAVAQCKATQEAAIRKGGKDIKERVAEMVKLFGELGVTRKMLEAYIGRGLDSITPALLVKLGGVYKSIRDGMSTPEDHFAAAMDRAAEKAEKTTRKRAAASTLLQPPAEAVDAPSAPEKAPSAAPATEEAPATAPAAPAETEESAIPSFF